MSKKITILTTNKIKPDIVDGDVGFLFETSTDSQFKYNNIISSSKLIGDQENTRRLACNTAKKILAGEPHFRGIPQLSVFQESISIEFEKAFNLIHLHDFLIKDNYTTCEFVTPSWWADGLSQLTSVIGSSLNIITPKSYKNNKLKRSLKRIYSNHFSLDAIKTEVTQAVNQIDPFHRRNMILNYFKKNNTMQGKLWFYTTALTYTNIGLLYEPYFPEEFCYLVEDPLTGGKPLKNKKRAFINFYNFALPKFIPTPIEVKEAANSIYRHILNASLDKIETIARNIVMNSVWLSRFFSESLAYGLFSSSVFEHWIRTTTPRALIVGNPVFENYALYTARHYKIPTILLQHGVVSDYFLHSDHPVDVYIMRGMFFYERLSTDSQKRAVILNPTKNLIPIAHQAHKKSIIFITAPSDQVPSAIEIDIESILVELIKTIAELPANLVIRVHPREKIINYKNKINKMMRSMTSTPKIIYSQGGDLDELLSGAAAVVMFASTLFLDCIKHQVPIISFNWHHFSFKHKLKSFPIFHFAEDLSNLRYLITQAIHGNLVSSTINADFFFENTTIELIHSKINGMLIQSQKMDS